jgi:hypothetical protein
MSSRKPTHTQFTHKKVIATIGDLIQYYNERGLTHITRILLYSAIIEGVGSEVHRYITTGALPYEEWSEEQHWTDKEEC